LEHLSRVCSTDILLLPYVWSRYALRSSGLFSEAVAHGVVTVVPRNTWMEDMLNAGYGAGTVFAEFSVDSITDALLAASADFPALKARALGCRDAWRRRHSAAAMLDLILNRTAVR
jgi:hypothetical protein